MTAPKPFKVVHYENGCAMVVDRNTRERVGYVLQDFHGWWEAFLDTERGKGKGHFPRRAEAASVVWAHHTKRINEVTVLDAPNRLAGNRYIALRCPMCDGCSPVCDQQADIARRGPAEWWQEHLRTVHPRPAPILERVEYVND